MEIDLVPILHSKTFVLHWLSLENRLSSYEFRLLYWEYKDYVPCVLCINQLENRDHLLFQFLLSKRIWVHVRHLCLGNNPCFCSNDVIQIQWCINDMNDERFYYQNSKSGLSAAICHILLQRNACTYNGSIKFEEVILKTIKLDIKV